MDQAKYIIDRFDKYFIAVNQKSAFTSGLHTFIIGALIAFLSWDQHPELVGWTFLATCLIVAGSFSSILFSILAVKPYLRSGNNDEQDTYLFFGSIAKHSLPVVRTGLTERSQAEWTEDYVRQVHQLAKGLDFKFKMLKGAAFSGYAAFLGLLILTLQIINN